MKHIESILILSEIKKGEIYLYKSDSLKSPIVVEYVEPNFQNEQHKKDYIESVGMPCMLRDLESRSIFDLKNVDYMDERYRVHPISKENLGFILVNYPKSKTKVIKHFTKKQLNNNK